MYINSAGHITIRWVLTIIFAFATGCSDGDRNSPPISDPPASSEPPLVTEPVQFLKSYQFFISNSSSPIDSFAISFTDGASTYQVQFDLGDRLRGSLNTIDETYTINAASVINVDSDAGDLLLGVFDVNVTSDIVLPVSGEPLTGEWQVIDSQLVSSGQAEVVTVAIVAGGVDVNLDGGPPTFFTWSEFRELFGDDSTPAWQQRAALSGVITNTIMEQAEQVRQSFVLIDGSLEIAGSVTVMCDAFTGTPPVGVLNQGMFTLTWLGSGAVAPGDAFNVNFTDCWMAEGDEGELANGTVDLLGYQTTVQDNTFINFGFFDPGQNPGGVSYNGLITATTVRNSSGDFTIDPSQILTITGGLEISFLGATP
jgi:hypothetical protein